MDPLRRGRRLLDQAAVERIETFERQEVEQAITEARAAVGPPSTVGVARGGSQ
jgi:hypothetical protein